MEHTHVVTSIFCIEEILYITIWAFLGSVLGFFSFSYVPRKAPIDNLRRCLKSICVGIFIAFPLCLYLEESSTFSKTLSITIGGLGAFGLPDILLNWWPKIAEAIASRAVTTISNNSVELTTKVSNTKRKAKGNSDIDEG